MVLALFGYRLSSFLAGPEAVLFLIVLGQYNDLAVNVA